MKRCPRCGETKPADEFYTDGENRRYVYCRDCARAYQRQRYASGGTKRPRLAQPNTYCPRCQQILTVDDFGYYQNGRRQSYCRACMSAVTTAWGRAHVEKRRAMQANQRLKQKRERLARVLKGAK